MNEFEALASRFVDIMISLDPNYLDDVRRVQAGELANYDSWRAHFEETIGNEVRLARARLSERGVDPEKFILAVWTETRRRASFQA